MKEYVAFWKNFLSFSERTSRRGYWMAVLMHFIVFILACIMVATLGRIEILSDFIVTIFSYGWVIYYFATIIPTLAITTRRLHDSNHSGWWIFINIVPIIGPFVIFVFTCLSSVDENNQYGDVQI